MLVQALVSVHLYVQTHKTNYIPVLLSYLRIQDLRQSKLIFPREKNITRRILFSNFFSNY